MLPELADMLAHGAHLTLEGRRDVSGTLTRPQPRAILPPNTDRASNIARDAEKRNSNGGHQRLDRSCRGTARGAFPSRPRRAARVQTGVDSQGRPALSLRQSPLAQRLVGPRCHRACRAEARSLHSRTSQHVDTSGHAPWRPAGDVARTSPARLGRRVQGTVQRRRVHLGDARRVVSRLGSSGHPASGSG
jgi:hypothetical protein